LHRIKKIKKMQKEKIESFKVIGISIRTSNENARSANDIGKLWEKFMAEGIANKIPNKSSEEVFSIYTNYEGDHSKPFDTILGCKVSSLDNVPDGMIGQSFDGGVYQKFVAKGDLSKGVVYNAWSEIWQKNLNRTFIADFEIYGEKSMDPSNAEVEILVGIKN